MFYTLKKIYFFCYIPIDSSIFVLTKKKWNFPLVHIFFIKNIDRHISIFVKIFWRKSIESNLMIHSYLFELSTCILTFQIKKRYLKERAPIEWSIHDYIFVARVFFYIFLPMLWNQNSHERTRTNSSIHFRSVTPQTHEKLLLSPLNGKYWWRIPYISRLEPLRNTRHFSKEIDKLSLILNDIILNKNLMDNDIIKLS